MEAHSHIIAMGKQKLEFQHIFLFAFDQGNCYYFESCWHVLLSSLWYSIFIKIRILYEFFFKLKNNVMYTNLLS